MHPKTLAIGFSALGVLCKMLDWCPCAEMGKGKFHIWQLFPSLLGLGWGGGGGCERGIGSDTQSSACPQPTGSRFSTVPMEPCSRRGGSALPVLGFGAFPCPDWPRWGFSALKMGIFETDTGAGQVSHQELKFCPLCPDVCRVG